MCDASDYAIGAVLSLSKDKKQYAISYASKTMCHFWRQPAHSHVGPACHCHHHANHWSPLQRIPTAQADKATTRLTCPSTAPHLPQPLTSRLAYRACSPLTTMAVPYRAARRSFGRGRAPTTPTRMLIKKLDLLSEPLPTDHSCSSPVSYRCHALHYFLSCIGDNIPHRQPILVHRSKRSPAPQHSSWSH
jgi:hypothetical protein